MGGGDLAGPGDKPCSQFSESAFIVLVSIHFSSYTFDFNADLTDKERNDPERLQIRGESEESGSQV